MHKMVLYEVLKAAEALSLEEQESLIETLHKRMVEKRRVELAKEIPSFDLQNAL